MRDSYRLCLCWAVAVLAAVVGVMPVSAETEAAAKAAAKPVAWHLSTAEIRVPVKVTVDGKQRCDGTYPALLRMPPQVYLADLKPLKVTGGLAFNPKTKSALQRDVRKPKEKADRSCGRSEWVIKIREAIQ